LVLPEARDQSQVQVEDILEPLDGSGRLISQDFNQIRPSLVPSRLHGIIVELLDTVGNAMLNLGSRESSVDARGGFRGVSAEEACKEEIHMSAGATCLVGIRRDKNPRIQDRNAHLACLERLHFHQQDRSCAQHSNRTL